MGKHIDITGFRLPAEATRIAVVGFNAKQVAAIEGVARERGIEVLDGGSISDGSNNAQKARRAAASAEVVFLNVKFARTLKREDLGDAPVVHVAGLSRLFEVLRGA